MPKRRGPYAAGSTRVRRKVQKERKIPLDMTIRPSVLEMAKRGAAYHQVGYLTYLHWLIEQTLQDEVRYYGWKVIPGYTILSVPTVSKSDRDKINRLSRNAGRKVEKALKDETKD